MTMSRSKPKRSSKEPTASYLPLDHAGLNSSKPKPTVRISICSRSQSSFFCDESMPASSSLAASSDLTPRCRQRLKKESASAYCLTRASSSSCEFDLRFAVT